MSKIRSAEDLEVFKRAHKVALNIYKITASYPKEELYGLVSQMRRAAVSINSNLAEGNARPSSKEYRQFIGIARGSLSELRYQINLSIDLGFISGDDSVSLRKDIDEVSKMLNALYKSIADK